MSNGRTHGKITKALILPTAAGAFLCSLDLTTAVFAGIGCAYGIICGPDLDIDRITENEAVLLRLARPLGWVWVAVWWPYAKLIPHRNPLSHWPIVGTLIRDVYFTALLLALAALVGLASLAIDTILLYWALYPELFVAFFVGQVVADSAHFAADVVSTKVKRLT